VSDFIKNIAALFPGPVNTAKYIRKSGIRVFFPFYHAISNSELPHLKHLYALRNVEQFGRDLDYMLKYFQPVKMSEYLGGKILVDPNRPPMVLSFDDGLLQCYEEVLPILISKGVPATFFVNNAFIDNRSMFFRFKVSLLVEHLKEATDAQKQRAAHLLHCEVGEIKSRLLGVSYVEREITDQVAGAWDYSFSEYMRREPVYLTSMHINKMLGEGFEFGSHGIDHPLFALLKRKTAIDHIQASVEDLRKRYSLDHRYFAFPFTDSGVQDGTIEHLFRHKIIDAGFGTAGLKDDKWPRYFQRVPMEMLDRDAKSTLRGEINRRRLRKLAGNNTTKR
jgi:peptidoglycan/xylan/chitin deacetylase (PgdA/CDA1 family)